MAPKQKFVVVGAGPVGSLAALYAAQRGYQVEIYELRPGIFGSGSRTAEADVAFGSGTRLNDHPLFASELLAAFTETETEWSLFVDLRDPSTVLLNFTRSINLALSERGINAMRHAGQPGLLDHVMAATIPMRGRMIHGRGPTGSLYEAGQDYDAHGRTIFAVDRAGLNKRLLDILESMPNVKFFFSHKLTGADFKKRKAWFEVMTSESATGRAREIEIDFDLMIGADGAHSAVRYHMMKYVQMNYRQDYIDTLWCEFHIEPKQLRTADKEPQFRISPNHLHIWPGKDFMFIAIPSTDGSFTSTLFMTSQQLAALERDTSVLPAFFDKHFPGVTDLIPPEALIAQFTTNPHLPLISVKCSPYHHLSSAVIVGDAAHAMVPFYGQGMNAGLEDVRVLFSILDKHAAREPNSPSGEAAPEDAAYAREVALAEYTATRVPDAHAINDLALQNYVEMRSSVLSPSYRLRKWLEETMSVYLPGLGWHTRYSRVSFSNERYADVVRRTDHQGNVLMAGFEAFLFSPFVVAAAYIWWKKPQFLVGGARCLVRQLLKVGGGRLEDFILLL